MLAKLVIQQPGNHIPVKWCRIWFLKIQKEVKSTQKQPSCKKSAALKAWVKKVVKSKVVSQEMAAMMSQPLLNFFSINIIAAISWLTTFDFTTYFTQLGF